MSYNNQPHAGTQVRAHRKGTRSYVTDGGGSGRQSTACDFYITNFVDLLASHPGRLNKSI